MLTQYLKAALRRARVHQLSASLLSFQHNSSDQRERVWQTERQLEVGCRPGRHYKLIEHGLIGRWPLINSRMSAQAARACWLFASGGTSVK